MNWDAIGATAELVGAAGVVASLLYLASQVRTSNRASAVEAKLESARLLNDFMFGADFVRFVESEFAKLAAQNTDEIRS